MQKEYLNGLSFVLDRDYGHHIKSQRGVQALDNGMQF